MQYDVSKAILTATLFFAVFNAGKTCVYAFLTVFLRHLGISPFQAGLLRCLQSICGGLAAPSVLHCSGLCAQRKFAMITCIFLTMGTYFVLLVTSLPTYTCYVRVQPVCDSLFLKSNASQPILSSQQVTQAITLPRTTKTSSTTTLKPTTEVLLNLEEIQLVGTTLNDNLEEDPTNQPIPLYYEPEPQKRTNLHNQFIYMPMQPYPYAQWTNLRYLQRRFKRSVSVNANGSIFDNLPSIKQSRQEQYTKKGLWPLGSDASCFIMLAILLVVGDIVCSPVDKLASTSWFSYLDEIDYTESHRRHLTYVPITTSLVVFSVGILNFYYCYLMEGQPFSSYHLHFYVFGCLLGFTFVMVSFFPQPYRSVSNTRSRNLTLPNGQPIYYYGDFYLILKYFCTNSTSCLLVLTSVINGILYACVHDFVPWYIEDMGGSQFAVSCAVALAYLSDAVGKVLVSKVQKNLSRNGLVVLGVLTYGVRFAFFTVLYTSWGIVFTQLVHCFSSVLFWKGMIVHVKRSYDDKKEQQILLVLSSFHYIIGYSIGTLVSGILYNMYHPLVLFWVMSCTAFAWGLFLFTCFIVRGAKVKRQRGFSLDDITESEQVNLFSVDSNDEENEILSSGT